MIEPTSPAPRCCHRHFQPARLPSHRHRGPRLRAATDPCRAHRRGRLPVLRRDQHLRAFTPAAVAHGLSVVERDPSPHFHRCDNRESGANNTAMDHIKRSGRKDSPTHATTSRVSCCAVPPEQRHEHPSRQNVHQNGEELNYLLETMDFLRMGDDRDSCEDSVRRAESAPLTMVRGDAPILLRLSSSGSPLGLPAPRRQRRR